MSEPVYTYPRWSYEADCLARNVEVPALMMVCEGVHSRGPCLRPRVAAELFDARDYEELEGDWVCTVCFGDIDRREAVEEEIANTVPCWSPDCEIRNAVWAERDWRLVRSGWVTFPDANLEPEIKAQWMAYRAALMSIPDDFASPDLVVWPTPPA